MIADGAARGFLTHRSVADTQAASDTSPPDTVQDRREYLVGAVIYSVALIFVLIAASNDWSELKGVYDKRGAAGDWWNGFLDALLHFDHQHSVLGKFALFITLSVPWLVIGAAFAIVCAPYRVGVRYGIGRGIGVLSIYLAAVLGMCAALQGKSPYEKNLEQLITSVGSETDKQIALERIAKIVAASHERRADFPRIDEAVSDSRQLIQGWRDELRDCESKRQSNKVILLLTGGVFLLVGVILIK